jgi:hypothetical protein
VKLFQIPVSPLLSFSGFEPKIPSTLEKESKGLTKRLKVKDLFSSKGRSHKRIARSKAQRTVKKGSQHVLYK